MRKKQMKLAIMLNNQEYILKHIRNKTVGVFLKDLWISLPTTESWDHVFDELEKYYPEINRFIYKRYNKDPRVEKAKFDWELELYSKNRLDINVLDRILEGENNG